MLQPPQIAHTEFTDRRDFLDSYLNGGIEAMLD